MTFFTVIGMSAMLNLAGGTWLVISDDVMGGKSWGETVPGADGMVFQGELSLENNGGFSSTRRMLVESPVWAEGVRLYLKGDGRQYQVRLRHDRNIDGVSWRAMFDTSGEWQSIELPFSEFQPVYRGRLISGAGPADPSEISQVGFLVADKRAGAFRLEVRKLGFY
jgi:monofunctional biosynthetic peptidoglycan transglycosylase